MKVIILSGLPGAGKSTWIEQQGFTCYRVVSADDYFTCNAENAEYKFDVSKLDEAHSSCLLNFLYYISPTHSQNHIEQLIVDNTNLTTKEIAPYYAIARAYKWEVTLVTFDVTPETAFARNVHGVPQDTIGRMYAKLRGRRIPWYWKLTFLRVMVPENGT